MGVILCDTFSYAKKAFKCKLVFGITAKWEERGGNLYLKTMMQRGDNAQGLSPSYAGRGD